MKAAVSYHKELMTILKEPAEASAYLNAALEAGDKKAFFLALRNVLEAQGGMTAFARKTKINRVSLYKMLSTKGNPGFENILFLLHAAGVTFRATPRLLKKNLRKAAQTAKVWFPEGQASQSPSPKKPAQERGQSLQRGQVEIKGKGASQCVPVRERGTGNYASKSNHL